MMGNLTKDKLSDMLISNRERRLIELLRDTKYGKIEIYLEAGQPVRVEKIKESVKL